MPEIEKKSVLKIKPQPKKAFFLFATLDLDILKSSECKCLISQTIN